MISVYVRQGRSALRRWMLHPRTREVGRLAAYVLSGLCLSAASLEQGSLPLVMGLVWACRGWEAVLTAVGGAVGYCLFWGQAGLPGLFWTGLSLAGVLLLGERRVSRDLPLLIPSLGMLVVSAVGLGFQLLAGDTTPVLLHLLRVALGGVTPWLFTEALHRRSPLLRWAGWGLMTLGLAQIAPFAWLGLGFVAAGAMTGAGAFPCAAMVGLALDLAGITAVPMTAVVVLAYLIRFLPGNSRWIGGIAPAAVGLLVMQVCGIWDLNILPGLLLGGLLGQFLPGPGKSVRRRGETGAAQVRLEMAAGVLSQTQQLLLEVPETEVDEDGLVTRAAQQACLGCAARKGCRDARKLTQLPGVLLHKPLLSSEELPVVCRKSNRFLAQLHRSQEQLRAIQADRERQREYREAVIQQYQFLSRFLQELADRLTERKNTQAVYEVQVSVYASRSEGVNGDRCLQFPGTGNQYYILLCDGMGTGIGAVQEGKSAAELLRKMLSCGFPAEYALRSLNSLCALRERAGAVTVDLVQISLDTGKVSVYKWGAAPSYFITRSGVEKVGTRSIPPGLCITREREVTSNLTMRPEQLLLLVSDGLGEEQVLRCCRERQALSEENLARALLQDARQGGEDDATVVTIRLIPDRT